MNHDDWEETLRHRARSLGTRLETRPPATLRRRVRIAVVAPLLLLAAVAVFFAVRPAADPADAIAACYRDAARLEERLDRAAWDEPTRRAFADALSGVDHAIRIASDAVRRDPSNPVNSELCHLAHGARARLIQVYLFPKEMP